MLPLLIVFLDFRLRENDGLTGVLACTFVTLAVKAGVHVLTDYISGFPAFAENDGLTGG